MDLLSLLINNNDSKAIKVPKSLLSEDQIALFNGFDEIGGDTTKYEDAMAWYRSCDNKLEAMTLCIVVLDKPAPYLFSGISNRDAKSFIAIIPKIKDKILDINDVTMSASSKVRKKIEIEALVEACDSVSLVNGKILFTGTTKTTLDEVLIRSMPLYTTSEIESFSSEQLLQMMKTRMRWKYNFSLVNISRMKRIALIYLELCPKARMINQGVKWINKHEGRPTKATKFGKNEKTIEIMKDDIKKLSDSRKLWIIYKKEFRRSIPADKVIETETVLNDSQLKFVSDMTVNLANYDLYFDDSNNLEELNEDISIVEKIENNDFDLPPLKSDSDDSGSESYDRSDKKGKLKSTNNKNSVMSMKSDDDEQISDDDSDMEPM
jgi:hypothetical protein